MSIEFDIGSGQTIGDPGLPEGLPAGRRSAWPETAPRLLSVAEADAAIRHDTHRPHPAVIAAALVPLRPVSRRR